MPSKLVFEWKTEKKRITICSFWYIIDLCEDVIYDKQQMPL